MHSSNAHAQHPMGLDVWFLVRHFIYFYISCVWTAKALAKLRGCAGLPDPSLLACVGSTIISWAGLYIFMEKYENLSLNYHQISAVILWLFRAQFFSRWWFPCSVEQPECLSSGRSSTVCCLWCRAGQMHADGGGFPWKRYQTWSWLFTGYQHTGLYETGCCRQCWSTCTRCWRCL